MKKYICSIGLLITTYHLSANPLAQDSTLDRSLSEVTVTAHTIPKYNVTKLLGGLRLDQQLLSIPQNIQIIDASVLKDQSVLNVNESVTRNVSGAFREELHNGISADIYARGGYINAQRNGVDLRPLLKGPLGDDISVVEGIEFVKGPSGFMNSLGDPAGSYNVVTKRADGIQRTNLSLTQGSFGLLRAETDLSGKLDQSDKLFFRLNLMGMSKKGFLRFDKSDRIVVAPSITYNIDSKTSLSAQYIYQQMNFLMLSEAQISPYGFGSLPINFTITDPSTRPYNAHQHDAFVNLSRKINQNWNFDIQVANINSKSVGAMYWVNAINKTDPDTLNRNYVYDAMQYNTFSVQAYLKGHFNTGSIKHSLLGGVDSNFKTNKTQDTWNTATTVYPLSISHPIYSDVINNNSYGGNFQTENTVNDAQNKTSGKLYYYSPFVMDQLSLFNDRLTATLGLRFTHAQSNFNKYGEQTHSNDNNLSPRLGLNYKTSATSSVYALYDNTFTPISGKAYNSASLKPIKGTSYEVGIKKEWFESFSSTLSLYHINRSNTVTKDPITNDIYQTGQNKTNGLEVDLKGRLLDNLFFTINYAYTDSKITKDDKNPDLVGQATPNRIRHIQNTWLRYSFTSSTLQGLSLMAGYQLLIGRSERFTTPHPAPMNDLFRADMGLSYERGKFSINLMVNNIFDAHQYSTAWKKNDLYYWVQLPPINYRCSVSIRL